jgi:DNA-binding transcriptional MerR regulator
LEKAPGAFRTISEVADEIDVPQHVLRFWESRFAQIRPMKRGGGRRFYRPDDVDLLRGVRHLLYGEGYTIRGVQRILREQGANFVQNIWRPGAEPLAPRSTEDHESEEIAAPAAERSEPDLPAFAHASPPAREGHAERREPSLAAAAAGVQVAAVGVTGEDRRKLRAALDELVACHRLIESVLVEDVAAGQGDANSGTAG